MYDVTNTTTISRMSVTVRLVLVLVALLVALHQAASLKLLRSGWLKDDTLYQSISFSRIEPRAVFVSDLLNEFPGLKVCARACNFIRAYNT